MKVDTPMDTYAARLASFNATLTSQKKRASDAKGTKTLKWPHAAPSITQLAKAGFYYKPTTSNPDNATCYLCQCNLDGWEEEDEPIAEHLKHSPSCGWANIAFVEQAVENGERELEDPSSERLSKARTMTFGSAWPHESKRGWVCKIQKMAEAGWYYCPTSESDDFVRCAYCNLSLDGWEPKDNPCDEHQRRSPDCLFFSLSASSSSATTKKSKKTRNSKASRMSAQSNLSVAPDVSSLVENDLHNDSLETVAEVVKPSKGGKKGSKGKKTKHQMPKRNPDDTQVGSSFVEPEDDDFEVKVAQPIVSTAKDRKRNSEEMHQTMETSGRSAPKRRRTTVRDSVASGFDDTAKPDEAETTTGDMDIKMDDVENKPSSSKSNSKKSKKGGKKRGSSSVRKASLKSAASEASLRAALPNDEDIDAALAEDLDRPLTDNDEDEELEVSEPPKGRRLTRSKRGTTATDASTAPTRRNTRNSTITVNDSLFEPFPIPSMSRPDGTQLQADAEVPALQSLPNANSKKKTGTRKASAKQKPKIVEHKNEEEVLDPAAEEEKAAKPRPTRGRKPSQQSTSQSHHISNISNLEPVMSLEPKIDNSMLDVHPLEEDSGRDTDADAKIRPKRGKKMSTAKKPVGGRGTGPKIGNIVDVVSEAAPDHLIVESQDTTVPGSTNSHDVPGLTTMESKKPIKKQNKPAKSGSKSKKNALMTVEVGDATQGIERSETERLVDVHSSPLAISMGFNPPPAPSPQSSDAENQPPSSRPSQSRPPLSFESPLRSQDIRVPLATIATPSASPSKGNLSKLQSTFPWTAIDMEQMLHGTPDAEKENKCFTDGEKRLTSPEKNLTVEEWIKYNAERGEAKLRNDCERLVGRFEDQGVRALKTLEGIDCVN